jgi:phosphoribosylaminoimidazole carboxylase
MRVTSGIPLEWPLPLTVPTVNSGQTLKAQVSTDLREAATKVASDAVACLPGVGIFGVELFAMADGTVFLNEVAPRPHNSGHFTIEACGCSQFEAHMRAVAGLPLPKDTSLRVGASLMLNILGDHGGSMAATKEELNRLSDVPGAAPHWYGKAESRKGRKMAHVTFCAPNTATLRANLQPVADIIGETAMPAAAPVVGVIMGSDSDLCAPPPSAPARPLATNHPGNHLVREA